jgi:hypothetical protein
LSINYRRGDMRTLLAAPLVLGLTACGVAEHAYETTRELYEEEELREKCQPLKDETNRAFKAGERDEASKVAAEAFDQGCNVSPEWLK